MLSDTLSDEDAMLELTSSFIGKAKAIIETHRDDEDKLFEEISGLLGYTYGAGYVHGFDDAGPDG